MSEQFSVNKVALNLNKTNIIKFKTKNSPQHTLSVGYKERSMEETVNTKFLGLQIDKHLNGKNRINQLVPKLSGACHAVRSVSHISSAETFISVYFAYFHSIIKYGIIFWGNSRNSRKIERYFHYKRKSLELWPVSNIEIHVEVCLRDWKS
jgi:hypothetical protein